MNEPFPTKRTGDGIIWVGAATDAAFRKALMDGVPPQLRPKMAAALSETPPSDAMEFSVRYFGKELADIKNRIAPLLISINKYLKEQRNVDGFFEWLNVTNLGNSQKLISVFKEWSEMKL